MTLPMRGRLPAFGYAVCLLLSGAGHGQTSPPQQGVPAQEDATSAYKSPAVLRATTRLVVVDVVATDSQGHPMAGLGIDDFAILEDGRPQKISGFTFRQNTTLIEVRRPANPNLFTN